MKKPLITSGQDWTFDMIEDLYDEINIIADGYGLDTYANQLEIISSEQMLDAYASNGLPLHYPHWSFGETFVKQMQAYTHGLMGLAYEIVINSKPCIAYLMEENTALMQALVMSHASFGHNTFFKTNYLFTQWTDAEGIIDYLSFAKKYIRECEEKHGTKDVESILDAAHALKLHGVDKYKRPIKLSNVEEEKQQKERDAYIQSQVNDLWNTIVPIKADNGKNEKEEELFPKEPQENLLYFIEKNAPRLQDWQREVIRIVRQISQYFYPQMQTKIMNEGCACFWHHIIIHDLHDKGILDYAAMIEFYTSHTNIIWQPDYDDPKFNGINPYALGFAMYKDIQRVTTTPTEEDKNWFRGEDWVGDGDWASVIKFATKNFKDESFISQYLSPKVIRDLKLFNVHDNEKDPKLEITAIHNHDGYSNIKTSLAQQNNIGYIIPDIQAVRVDRWGDRSLQLQHFMINGKPLDSDSTIDTLRHLKYLWGYDVSLESVDSSGKVHAEYNLKNGETLLDIFLDDDSEVITK